MSSTAQSIEVLGDMRPGFEQILTPAALDFVAKLTRKHRPRRHELMAYRRERQQKVDAGALPGFLPETQHVRDGVWQIAGIPADLQDRRVEITGPVDRKMIINALNTPVKCFMADFEDSAAPTWELMVQGHINLRDAIAKTISFEANGKKY